MIQDIRSIMENISESHSDVLSQFYPDRCITLLDKVEGSKAYRYYSPPKSVMRLWSAVTDRFGEDGFEAVQKATMLRLIERFDARSAGKRYTDDVRNAFARHFERILRSMVDPEFDKYKEPNDFLYKDLALCRQAVFPVVGRIVEPNSCFHLRLMHKGGLSQFARLSKILLETGGNWHWYELHTHVGDLEDFNPEGWARCLEQVAEMLELNPEVRGKVGAGWLNDPALEAISPHLVYIRKFQQDNGALVFYGGIDNSGNAIKASKTRRKLYESRQYVPKNYVLIWPRQQMIAWARSRKAGAGCHPMHR